jgi:hypothetical protein
MLYLTWLGNGAKVKYGGSSLQMSDSQIIHLKAGIRHQCYYYWVDMED